MREEVVGDHVRELLEPEIRHLGQDGSLGWDPRAEHAVVGGEAVGGHDEQAVVADGVDVPDLALVDALQPLQSRLHDGARVIALIKATAARVTSDSLRP